MSSYNWPPEGGGGVSSLNGETGAVTITGSGGITVTQPTSSTINIDGSGEAGTPGGSNTDIQFNDNGAFGGSSSLTWDGTIFNANGVNIDGSQSGDPTPEMYTTDWALNGDGSATFGNNGSPPIVQWDSAGNATVTSLTTMLFPGNAVTLQGGAAVAWTDGASVGTEGGGDLSLFAPGSIALNANTTISGNLSSGSDWFINNDGSFSFAQGEFAGDGSSNITNQGTYTQGNLFIDSSGNTTISGSSTLTVQEYQLPTGGVISDGGSGAIEITAPTTFINGDLVGSTWSITSSDGHVEFDSGLVSTSGTGALTASSFNGGSFNGDGSGLSDIPLSALNVTVSGSTTELATVNGSLTSGHTVLIDSSGNLVDAGIAPIANPMTTLGDIIYENSTPTPARLAGNTSATLAVLTQTGTGSVSAPPVWTSTTGTGNIVRATSPTLTTPIVGTQSQGDSSTKAASTAYVDTAVSNAVAGINPAVAVQAATTTASNTSGYTYNNGASGIGATFTGANNTALTVDGFTFTAIGQRLLVKNDTQSPSGAFNGIYSVTQVQATLLPLILTRVTDYDQPSDINNTGAIPVVNGTVNGTTSWVQTAQIVTVGTTPLVFVIFTQNPASYLTNPMTTGGDIIYGGTSGVPTRLANSSAGQTLTSTGGTSAPTWGPFVYSSPVSYTPTLVNFGTPTAVSFTWARMGKYLIVQGVFSPSAGPASTVTLSLPSGLTVDSAVTAYTPVGWWVGNSTQVTGSAGNGPMLAQSGTSVVYFSTVYNTTLNSSQPQPGSDIWAGSGNQLSVQFTVPISAWT